MRLITSKTALTYRLKKPVLAKIRLNRRLIPARIHRSISTKTDLYQRLTWIDLARIKLYDKIERRPKFFGFSGSICNLFKPWLDLSINYDQHEILENDRDLFQKLKKGFKMRVWSISCLRTEPKFVEKWLKNAQNGTN